MLRFFIIVIVISFLPVSFINAQTSEYECTDLTSELDISSICESVSNCEDTDANCLQKGTSILLDACRRNNLDNCEIRSILYWIINHHLQTDKWYLYHPDNFEPSFMATVTAFDNGDYENAILEYEDVVNSDNYTTYFTLEIVHGLLYYVDGKYEQAFKHLSNSIDSEREIFSTRFSEFNNSIAYYYRGQIYRLWGDEERALQDFYLYDSLAIPELKAQLPLSPFRLIMNNPQTWLLYPVFEHTVYGGWYADHSMREPRNVLLSFANNGETLVVSGLLERDRYQENTPEILFLERDPEEPSDYYLNLNTPDYGIKQATYHLTITITPTHLEYYEIIWHIEGTLDTVAMLLKPSEPDIRQNVTNRLCDGSALSFINIGDSIINMKDELSLVNEPNSDEEVELLSYVHFSDEVTPFIVQEGPICHDEKIWWQVTNGNLTGWLIEVNVKGYDGHRNPAPVYQIMPVDLLKSWRNEEAYLRSIFPTPLEFLGLSDLLN